MESEIQEIDRFWLWEILKPEKKEEEKEEKNVNPLFQLLINFWNWVKSLFYPHII